VLWLLSVWHGVSKHTLQVTDHCVLALQSSFACRAVLTGLQPPPVASVLHMMRVSLGMSHWLHS
jgi:hypothetical protein